MTLLAGVVFIAAGVVLGLTIGYALWYREGT